MTLMLAVIGLGAAVLAPPIAELGGWELHRVLPRLLLIFTVVVLIAWNGWPRPARVAEALGPRPFVGFALGWGGAFALLLLLTAFFFAIEAQVAQPEVDDDIALKLVEYFASALAVGLIEEAFFRGWLWRALQPRLGLVFSAVVASIVYSWLHYLNPDSTPGSEPSIAGSFAVYRGMLEDMGGPFHEPFRAIGLFLFGLLLCAAVLRTRSLAAAMGIHAGVVFYIKADGRFLIWTYMEPAWFFGSRKLYDGLLLWGVIIAVIAVLLGWPRRRSPERSAEAPTPPAEGEGTPS